MSGLVKLLYPDPSNHIPDVDLEWIVRLALEAMCRVKEQQRRVFKSEFRNTHFSYTVGADGVETFVATPELRRRCPRHRAMMDGEILGYQNSCPNSR